MFLRHQTPKITKQSTEIILSSEMTLISLSKISPGTIPPQKNQVIKILEKGPLSVFKGRPPQNHLQTLYFTVPEEEVSVIQRRNRVGKMIPTVYQRGGLKMRVIAW